MLSKEELKRQTIRRSRNWAIFWGIILLIFSVTIILIPILHVNWYYPKGYSLKTGVTGDTLGGMTAPFVGLLGAFLVFLALRAQIAANNLIRDQLEDQKEENEIQKRITIRQNFEITFFNLLTIHQGFVEHISIKRNGIAKHIANRLKSPTDNYFESEHTRIDNPDIVQRAVFKPTYLMN